MVTSNLRHLVNLFFSSYTPNMSESEGSPPFFKSWSVFGNVAPFLKLLDVELNLGSKQMKDFCDFPERCLASLKPTGRRCSNRIQGDKEPVEWILENPDAPLDKRSSALYGLAKAAYCVPHHPQVEELAHECERRLKNREHYDYTSFDNARLIFLASVVLCFVLSHWVILVGSIIGTLLTYFSCMWIRASRKFFQIWIGMGTFLGYFLATVYLVLTIKNLLQYLDSSPKSSADHQSSVKDVLLVSYVLFIIGHDIWKIIAAVAEACFLFIGFQVSSILLVMRKIHWRLYRNFRSRISLGYQRVEWTCVSSIQYEGFVANLRLDLWSSYVQGLQDWNTGSPSVSVRSDTSIPTGNIYEHIKEWSVDTNHIID